MVSAAQVEKTWSDPGAAGAADVPLSQADQCAANVDTYRFISSYVAEMLLD